MVPIDTIYLVIIIEVYFNLTSFRYIFIIILLKSNCQCPNNLPLPDEGRAIPLRKKNVIQLNVMKKNSARAIRWNGTFRNRQFPN